MAAGKYSFTIEQGSTVNIPLIYKDSAGVPVNLTQYSSKMQIRDSYGSTPPIITLTSTLTPDGTGLDMSTAAVGGITICIASCVSSLFTFTDAIYDLDIISGSGDCPIITRILEGKIRLSKEVTVYS
jgi:hypothetical protein